MMLDPCSLGGARLLVGPGARRRHRCNVTVETTCDGTVTVSWGGHMYGCLARSDRATLAEVLRAARRAARRWRDQYPAHR